MLLRDVGSYIRGLTYSSNDVIEEDGILVGLTILSTEVHLIIIMTLCLCASKCLPNNNYKVEILLFAWQMVVLL